MCAGGDSKAEYRIHLATSHDCVTWTRHPANPVVVDGYKARDPMVVRVGDRWVMYYTATSAPDGGNHVVAAVESDDLVRWSNRRDVYVDPLVGTMAGPTESPFVMERDGRWYLFRGPARFAELLEPGREIRREWKRFYSHTSVIESDDPFHFNGANEVGMIEAHAAEVIVDVDDSTWISHCGWGEGGVHLAPLHFE